MNTIIEKLYFFSLSFIASLIIFASIFYWLFNFFWYFQLISFVLALIFSIFIYSKFFNINNNYQKKQLIKKFKIVHLIFTLSLILSWIYILSAQNLNSLNSPWQYINNNFFLSFLVLIISTLIINYKNLKFKLLSFTLLFFTASSIAVLIYHLGYGFDPFIHEAGIKAIIELGEISPKTLYYTGQYVLIILLNQISSIPVSLINQYLVPSFSAIFIPFSLYHWYKKTFNSNNALALLALLILPISLFTITTPQNLAYSFLLITIFLGLISDKKNLLLASLLSVTTFFIHPLAGIPALIFTFLSIIYYFKKEIGIKRQNILSYFIYIVTAIAIPSSFLLINNFKFKFFPIFKFDLFRSLSLSGHEDIILNLNYLYSFNLPLIILLLIISGFLIWKNKYQKISPTLSISLKMSIALFISYVISQYISFDFLIDYERDYYRQRLLILSSLFSLPIIIIFFHDFFLKLKKQNNIIKLFFLSIISFSILASVYSSYPRVDKYFNSHSFSLSTYDLETVSFIEDLAQEKEDKGYIVLANQQVSVAALKTFGFNRYIKDDLYFYPIPTSGPLYPYYLKMVYDYPSRENIKEATTIAGVDKGFLVLNKYWWGFKRLVEEAKIEADDFYQLNDGDIYIFQYNF